MSSNQVKCPNCSIELERKYGSTADSKGREVLKPMMSCSVCSYGWFIDWRDE